MLSLLFRKETKISKSSQLTEFLNNLKDLYNYNSITPERKSYLTSLLDKYGYIPYPHVRALEELSDAETLFCVEYKWAKNGVYTENSFLFKNSSVLARNNVKNSNWIKKEGHNIKLINLAGLGNGNEKSDTGKLIDWLRQIAILPTGSVENGIFSTTVYLIPFHPREFGCAYLPTSSAVSPNLKDVEIEKKTGYDENDQVKLFIQMAQLAGHPVIYDILPQTGRYSKIVLANPECARWFDINALIEELEKNVDKVSEKFADKYSKEDLEIVKDLYKKSLHSGVGDLSEHYRAIYNDINDALIETKKFLSSSMLERGIQIKLARKAKKIIASVLKVVSTKKLKESDIDKQGEVIQRLITEGMWPAPGGAWCSAGVPIFDRMSDCGSYPTFKHYNFKGEDVSKFANLDCQTPYYFVNLENGTYNKNVVDFFINYMKQLQADFNFDGFRVDHIDHIVDEVSEKDGVPISYRAPRKVLGRLNSEMKSKIPYFGTLAEYMLWDNFLKEYHQDMNFDTLWGADIVGQSDKTPETIANDNLNLTNYNTSSGVKSCLSILKTYNNQDGEFEAIDRYPGQLGEQGALFKWFKQKFIPGGKFAQRAVMYIDGDESFTTRGIESVIGSEISMPREKDYEFYSKFNAIDKFAKESAIITGGEAHIMRQDEDGFVVWQISKEGCKTSLLVVANYHNPTEKFTIWENGYSHTELREGCEVFDKEIELSCDYKITSQYVFDGEEFVEEKLQTPTTQLMFSKIMPAEFKFYAVEKV